jgi:hypothetical protein
VCEVGFQHMTDIVSAAVKQKGEVGGEDESEICTAVRRSLKQLTKTSHHYKLFLIINVIFVKENVN